MHTLWRPCCTQSGSESGRPFRGRGRPTESPCSSESRCNWRRTPLDGLRLAPGPRCRGPRSATQSAPRQGAHGKPSEPGAEYPILAAAPRISPRPIRQSTASRRSGPRRTRAASSRVSASEGSALKGRTSRQGPRPIDRSANSGHTAQHHSTSRRMRPNQPRHAIIASLALPLAVASPHKNGRNYCNLR